MIKLKTTGDREFTEKLFKENNLEFNGISYCLTAYLGDEILGYCLYYLNDTEMTVLKIEPDDDLGLADGILRSTLHVAAERFVLNAFYKDEKTEKLCEKLSFIKDKSEKRLDIDKLFGGCECCGKNCN